MSATLPGSTGATEKPQWPMISVVTPWRTLLSALGLIGSVKSEWVLMSMKPGATASPRASMTFAASPGGSLPMAANRPAQMATSPGLPAAPVPSSRRPPRMRTSCSMPDAPCRDCPIWLRRVATQSNRARDIEVKLSEQVPRGELALRWIYNYRLSYNQSSIFFHEFCRTNPDFAVVSMGPSSEEGSRHPVSPHATRLPPPVRWMPAPARNVRRLLRLRRRLRQRQNRYEDAAFGLGSKLDETDDQCAQRV